MNRDFSFYLCLDEVSKNIRLNRRNENLEQVPIDDNIVVHLMLKHNNDTYTNDTLNVLRECNDVLQKKNNQIENFSSFKIKSKKNNKKDKPSA